jgi:signal transduction histidine kinase
MTLKCANDLRWRGSQNAFNIVLGNLLENAIKYSTAKGPIFVKAEKTKDFLKISIEDAGLGLSKRDRKRIFKMFYRSKDATSRAIHGTGLGLFIVKTTLEQLGGRIEVASAGVGEGTTFTASFPL